jgi:pimeloyl-ACP methyl ester carboxylesterase
MGDPAQVVQVVGDGPAVVLLHGWPVTSAHWRFIVPALVEAGHRAVVIDLPGLGSESTSSNRQGPYDKPSLVKEVRAIVDNPANGIASFALIGHDWGATVAWLLAAEMGERVTHLVLEEEIPPGVDVVIPEPGLSHYPNWHGQYLRTPGLAETELVGREETFYRKFLEESAGPAGLDPNALEDYISAYQSAGQLEATIGLYRSGDLDAEAVQGAKGKIETPVLTIGGEYGLGNSVHQTFAALSEGANVRHLNVLGAGHYPAEQVPELVIPTLLAYLRI